MGEAKKPGSRDGSVARTKQSNRLPEKHSRNPFPAEAHASVSSFQVAILSHTPTACSRKDGLVGRLVLIVFIRLLLREVPPNIYEFPRNGTGGDQ